MFRRSSQLWAERPRQWSSIEAACIFTVIHRQTTALHSKLTAQKRLKLFRLVPVRKMLYLPSNFQWNWVGRKLPVCWLQATQSANQKNYIFPYVSGSVKFPPFPLFYDQPIKKIDFFHYPRVSTGALPLTKKPVDSGYEIGNPAISKEMCVFLFPLTLNARGLWGRDWVGHASALPPCCRGACGQNTTIEVSWLEIQFFTGKAQGDPKTFTNVEVEECFDAQLRKSWLFTR